MATHTLDWRETPDPSCRNGAVAIGNFDGVHRGHAALIAALRTQAAAVHGPAVALTFDPRPMDLLRPALTVPPLTTTPERARLLHELGADQVIVLRTTKDLLALRAHEFFTQVVKEHLNARAMVEGVNFGFGHKREGNIETLRQLCLNNDVALTIVPPMECNGIGVSSRPHSDDAVARRGRRSRGTARPALSAVGNRRHGTAARPDDRLSDGEPRRHADAGSRQRRLCGAC